jgi:branched-chain amino acid aminotransferase
MPEIKTHVSPRLKPLPPAKELRFGQTFSDHWFHARFSEDTGWFEASINPYGPLTLDPAASVFHYGQALFEGMKAFHRHDGSIGLFRPEFNYQRLQNGAERLCLQAPPRDLFFSGLRELIRLDRRWVPADDGCSLYIRPTLIGTEAFLGVRPSRQISFFILLSPVGSYYSGAGETVRIMVEEHALRAAPGGLGDTKAGANYAASLQAGLNAKQKGFSQVLWLDTARDGIEEVGTMNVFFVLKDEIVTPALSGSILPGSVRDSVLHLLRHEGARISERRITISELHDRPARGEVLEAFGTGTAATISPIGELNWHGQAHVLNDRKAGPVARELADRLKGIQRGTAPDPFGWMISLDDLK